MRKKLIIGNWKMNLNMQEASLYLHKLMEVLKPRRDVEVVVSPTALTLQSLSLQINRRIAKLAAQNCYWRDHGAYTGEVPAAHLRGIADYVLIGHSERRYIFIESDKDIRLKVQAAIRNRLQPILCIGETAQERALGETRDVLADQLTSGLANVTAEELDRVVIAYEPIWAIGTGDNAKPVDVKKATQMIRQHVAHLYGKKAAEEVRILYGGSITVDSAADYLAISGLDGLLVGAASLDIHQFTEIIEKAHKG
ncbi:triose-phosphate isomerase [TM7 phylum sp. oral taxon 353]|nr:triose-phosphate isomerase [TM7 phylum sp. oral taxon 353]